MKECKVVYFRHKTGPKLKAEMNPCFTGVYSSLEDANEDFSPAGDVTHTQNLYIKIQRKHNTEPVHTNKLLVENRSIIPHCEKWMCLLLCWAASSHISVYEGV